MSFRLQERRLFYVAVTRTRNTTYLIVPEGQESPFETEIAEDSGVEVVRMDGCRGKNVDRCPVCKSGVLVERTGEYGSFIGCSNYPHCRYHSNARKPAAGERPCPLCGSALEKKTRRADGHVFLGCSNYPKCLYSEDAERNRVGHGGRRGHGCRLRVWRVVGGWRH